MVQMENSVLNKNISIKKNKPYKTKLVFNI